MLVVCIILAEQKGEVLNFDYFSSMRVSFLQHLTWVTYLTHVEAKVYHIFRLAEILGLDPQECLDRALEGKEWMNYYSYTSWL